MSKKLRESTASDIVEIVKLLRKGRDRYDNELLKIEQIWAKLKPHEYLRRQSLVKVMVEMTEIDQAIKVWENKLL